MKSVMKGGWLMEDEWIWDGVGRLTSLQGETSAHCL